MKVLVALFVLLSLHLTFPSFAQTSAEEYKYASVVSSCSVTGDQGGLDDLNRVGELQAIEVSLVPRQGSAAVVYTLHLVTRYSKLGSQLITDIVLDGSQHSELIPPFNELTRVYRGDLQRVTGGYGFQVEMSYNFTSSRNSWQLHTKDDEVFFTETFSRDKPEETLGGGQLEPGTWTRTCKIEQTPK